MRKLFSTLKRQQPENTVGLCLSCSPWKFCILWEGRVVWSNTVQRPTQFCLLSMMLPSAKLHHWSFQDSIAYFFTGDTGIWTQDLLHPCATWWSHRSKASQMLRNENIYLKLTEVMKREIDSSCAPQEICNIYRAHTMPGEAPQRCMTNSALQQLCVLHCTQDGACLSLASASSYFSKWLRF